MQYLISWKQYLTTSILFVFFYYAFIALRFYKYELLNLKFVRRVINGNIDSAADEPNTATKTSPSEQAIHNPLQEKVGDFKEELVALLKQSSAQKTTQNNLVETLKKLAVKYNDLKASHFKDGLVETTDIETENICQLHLSKEELASIWD